MQPAASSSSSNHPSRPAVGILHRKPSASGVPTNNFSSLSLLPGELNRSLSSIDDHDSETSDLPQTSSNSDTKIIMQTAPRRGSVSANESDATLVYNTSYGGKMKFTLNSQETSIGRKEDNDITLSCARISKRHATIVRLDERSV